MDRDDFRRSCARMWLLLRERGGNPWPIERGARLEHAAWMIAQAIDFYDAGRVEKAMRWLGFAQGCVWALGLAEIDELKEANRPMAKTER